MPLPHRARPCQLHHPKAHGPQSNSESSRQTKLPRQTQNRRLGRRLSRKSHCRMIFSPDSPDGQTAHSGWEHPRRRAITGGTTAIPPGYTVHLESRSLHTESLGSACLEAIVGGRKALVWAKVGGVLAFQERSGRLKLTVQTPECCDEDCEDELEAQGDAAQELLRRAAGCRDARGTGGILCGTATSDHPRHHPRRNIRFHSSL